MVTAERLTQLADTESSVSNTSTKKKSWSNASEKLSLGKETIYFLSTLRFEAVTFSVINKSMWTSFTLLRPQQLERRKCTGGDVHRNYSTLPLSPGVLNEHAGCSVCFGIAWFCGGKSYFCICFCCIIVWDFFWDLSVAVGRC